ncbi:hypothetical protein RKD20_009267 [Streptomyces sp. SLBN-8D4]|jgi:hypothetical protein
MPELRPMASTAAGRHKSRRPWLYGTAAVVASLSTVMATAGSAGADQSKPTAPFAAQANAFGLSTVEAKTLQSRVDTYLAQEGGTQIAANKIRLTDGGVLVLTLPSGHPAYGKDENGKALASYTCDYEHFCAFSGTNFTGNVRDWYYCRENPMPFMGHGSWKNNQTTGTVANFESGDHVSRWHDTGAYTEDDDADWSWVHWVRNC